jgi:hypothetical protein
VLDEQIAAEQRNFDAMAEGWEHAVAASDGSEREERDVALAA